MFTREGFAALLIVDSASVNGPAPLVPAATQRPIDRAGLHGGPRGQAAYDHAETNPDICWATCLLRWPYLPRAYWRVAPSATNSLAPKTQWCVGGSSTPRHSIE